MAKEEIKKLIENSKKVIRSKSMMVLLNPLKAI